MKLLTSNVTLKGETKEYLFLCLENIKDAEYYIQLNSLIKSKQAISFWMGFKSQSGNFIRESPLNYLVHEEPSNNIIANALAIKMNLSEEPTSLVKYCTDADVLIQDMNFNIVKHLTKGCLIRINAVGGYCPIENYNDYEKVVDINEQEMYNFLLHQSIDFKFEITKPTLVIENDNYIPIKLIDDFCDKTKTNKEDIQIITSFKHRTILFKQKDYIEFFDNGLLDGLTTVVFETTAQDNTQIESIKKILEYLMRMHPDKTLTIYAKVYDSDKHLFETDGKNIKINFL